MSYETQIDYCVSQTRNNLPTYYVFICFFFFLEHRFTLLIIIIYN